ncbi:hypothetical protein GQR58_025466 [Nymphon striatum]|nr:hypothetical protein GQR58_025466 [Nymphon striatum]
MRLTPWQGILTQECCLHHRPLRGIPDHHPAIDANFDPRKFANAMRRKNDAYSGIYMYSFLSSRTFSTNTIGKYVNQTTCKGNYTVARRMGLQKFVRNPFKGSPAPSCDRCILQIIRTMVEGMPHRVQDVKTERRQRYMQCELVNKKEGKMTFIRENAALHAIIDCDSSEQKGIKPSRSQIPRLLFTYFTEKEVKLVKFCCNDRQAHRKCYLKKGIKIRNICSFTSYIAISILMIRSVYFPRTAQGQRRLVIMRKTVLLRRLKSAMLLRKECSV